MINIYQIFILWSHIVYYSVSFYTHPVERVQRADAKKRRDITPNEACGKIQFSRIGAYGVREISRAALI